MAQPRDHQGGFFLRMSGGIGVANTEIEDVFPTTFGLFDRLRFSGTSADWNFAVGAVVTPNLVLHGTTWGWAVSDPGVEVDSPSYRADGTIAMNALGGGVTYYFMPGNIYLSGSVGIGGLNVDSQYGLGHSGIGIAFDISAGKEWWLGNTWGMGVAGGFSMHSIPDEDLEEQWHGTSLAVRLSVTHN